MLTRVWTGWRLRTPSVSPIPPEVNSLASSFARWSNFTTIHEQRESDDPPDESKFIAAISSIG
jgi:hypothetical protein